MELLELMKYRRSIRKYEDRQISRDDLEKVIRAGLYAPSAGGGQRSMIVAVHNPEPAEKLGRLNAACMDRSRLTGAHVSAEQPSIIDDPAIRSGFYGAPTVCVVFAMKNFLYSIPDAFCCAENMVLEATDLGLASCIIARAEATFALPEAQAMAKAWGVPEDYEARCFVLLGYCRGDYPKEKPRKPGRCLIVEA
jgi:nitroreductase